MTKFNVQKNITTNVQVEASDWDEAHDIAWEELRKQFGRDNIHDYYQITNLDNHEVHNSDD